VLSGQKNDKLNISAETGPEGMHIPLLHSSIKGEDITWLMVKELSSVCISAIPLLIGWYCCGPGKFENIYCY